MALASTVDDWHARHKLFVSLKKLLFERKDYSGWYIMKIFLEPELWYIDSSEIQRGVVKLVMHIMLKKWLDQEFSDGVDLVSFGHLSLNSHC